MAYEYLNPSEGYSWQRHSTQNFFKAFLYHNSKASLSAGLSSLNSMSELTGYFSKALLMVKYTTCSSGECSRLTPPPSHECSSSRLGVPSFHAGSNEGNMNVTILFNMFFGVFLFMESVYTLAEAMATQGETEWN